MSRDRRRAVARVGSDNLKPFDDAETRKRAVDTFPGAQVFGPDRKTHIPAQQVDFYVAPRLSAQERNAPAPEKARPCEIDPPDLRDAARAAMIANNGFGAGREQAFRATMQIEVARIPARVARVIK